MKRSPITNLLLLSLIVVLVVFSFATGCSRAETSTPTTGAVSTTAAAQQPATSSTTPAASSPAAVNKIVRVGIMGGQTGPAAGVVIPWLTELEYFLRYINEVEGGIDGIKLEWRIIDNKGTPEGAITAYKELRDSYKPDLYFVIEEYYLSSIREMINEDQAVVITSSPLDPRFYVPPQHFFTIAIPTCDGLAGYAKWIMENWEGPGQPKLGVLYWDMATGEMAYNMAKSWINSQGIETVPISYKYSVMDFKPQLMRLRDAGVTHIFLHADSQQAALLIRDMKALGLTGKIPVAFNEMVEADVVIKLAGQDAEGYYVLRSESPYADQEEAAKMYTRIWEWAGTPNKWSDNRLPLTVKAVITAAIREAAAVAGPDNINNITLYEALNRLTRIDTWENSHDFGYGPDRRLGVQTMKITQIKGDRTISASDYIVLPRTFEGIDK